MMTLYDLLGALPEDNADDVRAAFRNAVKAVHPDTNPDDPNAALRLRMILRANAILGDPEQRAAYDRLLAVSAAQARPKPKRASAARAIRKFAFDALAVATVSTLSIGGYLLFEQLSNIPIPPPQVAEAGAPPPAAAAAPAPQFAATVQDKPDAVTGARHGPPDKPDAALAARDKPPDTSDGAATVPDVPSEKPNDTAAARAEAPEKPDGAAAASETIVPDAVAPAPATGNAPAVAETPSTPAVADTGSAPAAADTASVLANANAGPAPEPAGQNAGSSDPKAVDAKAVDAKAIDAKARYQDA